MKNLRGTIGFPRRALRMLLVEPSEAAVGGSFSPLEAILGRHGAILGPLGAIREASWAVLS